MIEHTKDGNCLMIGDFSGMSVQDAREQLCEDYEITDDEIEELLVMWSDEGSYDAAHQIVLRSSSGAFMYHEASHCSCYGFEDLWGPSEVPLEYILEREWGYYSQEELGELVRAHMETFQ